MKDVLEIVLKVPLDICIQKYHSTDNLKHWQRGLISVEHISGTPGNFGAKMKMEFQIGNKKMELVETITYENLPKEVHGIYSMKHLDIIQENHFTAINDMQTRWTITNEYIPLNFKMLLMLLLTPKMFKKQSWQYMIDFKNFVENQISITHETTKVNLGF